ncbi:hypothetical protein K490DRAFT_63094 [Saccharata proteae CBS 121410]|uniref:ARM repeat-containing protein n=1 Tax=Saccharata proteae CBS 121410 TaxID=1314787 RepID=A0A9P4HYL4_9PEZI|nr:hypothetical protein K490DRAFT_63094 [Saccharata proteae CBS 121410]
MADTSSSQLPESIESLLSECEQISHDERMTHMVKLGRQAVQDSSIQNLINQLQHGPLYEQILGLQTSHGSRNAEFALDAIKSSSLLLSGRAVSIVARLASTSDILSVTPVLSKKLLGTLIGKLRRSRRRDVVDAIILDLSQTKRDEEALRLFLPYGTPALVEKLVPQISTSFKLREWQRLSRCRPTIAVAALTEKLEQMDSYEIERVMTGVLPVLARTDVSLDPIFGLVRTALKFVSINSINISSLVQRFPQQVVGLILEGDELITYFPLDDGILRYLTPNMLLHLQEKQPQIKLSRHLPYLTAEHHLALYQSFANSMRSEATGLLSLTFTSGLPSKERMIEARRALSLDPVELKPIERTGHAALLPWDEAMQYNAAYLRDDDPEVRAAAVDAQIKATKYQRNRLPDALKIGLGCRNELDMVRRRMLKAYAKLPRGMWKDEHLPQLAQIIQDMLKASDTHNFTTQEACALVLRLHSVHTEWSARQFATLFKALRDENWTTPFDSINAESCSQERRQWMVSSLTFALTPLLCKWNEEQNQNELINIASSRGFEPLVEFMPAVMNVLDAILKTTKSTYHSDRILEVIKKHRHADYAPTIERLIANDPSCIKIETVRNFLYRRRQHLLTPFLRGEPILQLEPLIRGVSVQARFEEKTTPYHLSFETGLFRLTQAQQELYAQSCMHAVQHNDHWDKAWKYRQNIRILRKLTYTDVAASLSKLTSDENPVIKDTALRSLGHLEGGKGVPALLQAIENGDTRTAIAPLGLQLKELSPEKALSLLKEVPATEVTVMKEVVRLVGDLGTDDAYNYLLSIETRPKLHKDIHIAVLHSLEKTYVNRDLTWSVFNRAVDKQKEADHTIPMAVTTIPSTGITSGFAKSSLTTLIARLLAHPISQIRRATLVRLTHQPIPDPTSHLTSLLTILTNSPISTEFKSAATIIFRHYAPFDPSLPALLFREYLQKQDYPRLTQLFNLYTQDPHHLRKRLLRATHAVLDVLAANELTTLLHLRLCFAGLPFPALLSRITALDSTARLQDPDVFATLDKLICELRSSGGSRNESGGRSEDEVVELEGMLVGSGDERMRALGVSAVVAQSLGLQGWTERLMGVLEGLRGDRSAIVRKRAVFVVLPRWADGRQ